MGTDYPITERNWKDSAKDFRKTRQHPIDQGVEMQLHHILAENTFKKLKKGIRDKIEKCHYDINQANNVVALPEDLKAACILHVQPHRGGHPEAYFKETARAITDDFKRGKLGKKIKKHVKKSGKELKESIQEELDEISKDMLEDIANFDLLIHTIGADFKTGGKGCCDRIDVGDQMKAENKCREHNRDRTVFKKNPKIRLKTETNKEGETTYKQGFPIKKDGKWKTEYKTISKEVYDDLQAQNEEIKPKEIDIKFNGTWTLKVGR